MIGFLTKPEMQLKKIINKKIQVESYFGDIENGTGSRLKVG